MADQSWRYDANMFIAGYLDRVVGAQHHDGVEQVAVARLGTRNGEGTNGGGEGVRTPDLSIANAALSQLSYTPVQAPV
jgi:hypothetical protein